MSQPRVVVGVINPNSGPGSSSSPGSTPSTPNPNRPIAVATGNQHGAPTYSAAAAAASNAIHNANANRLSLKKSMRTGSSAGNNKTLIGLQQSSPASGGGGGAKRNTMQKRLSMGKGQQGSAGGASNGGVSASASAASTSSTASSSSSAMTTIKTNLPKINTPQSSSPQPSPGRLPHQPQSPAGTAAANRTAGSSPVNATIVLRRPPSPLSSASSTPNHNLLSIGLASPSPGHSRRNSAGHLAAPGHGRSVSGGGSGFQLPSTEDLMGLNLTPRAGSLSGTNLASPTNEIAFDSLDDMVIGNPAYRDVFRIVRLIAAQPSCDQMVLVLEKHLRQLVKADAVRVLLVTRHGFTHPTLSQALSLDQGLASHCIHKRECLNLSHPSSDPRFYPDTDQLSERPPMFEMCVPVEGDPNPNCAGPRDVVALIQIFRETPSSSSSQGSGVGSSSSSSSLPFSLTDIKIVQRLSEFVGNMLLRSRHADRAYALYNTSVSTQKRSAALLDVAKALSSETRLSDVVSVIVSQVPEILDADRCTLFFVDKDRQELIVTRGASHGRHKNLVSWIFGQSNAPELPFRDGENEFRFSMANGIAGHVARTGEIINVADAHTSPLFNSSIDIQTGYRTRSLLCVPMIDGKGETIGVLQCINKNPLFPRFDSQDETLLKTFSAQAAVAVRNSRLFEKTENALRQSDALLEIANALSSELKIEGLISIICNKVQQLLHSERCTVFIVDKERRELYTSESMSFGMGASLPIDKERAKLLYFPMDRGIAGSVATTGISANIPDAYKDIRFNQKMDKETGFRTRAILCMAIKNSSQEVCGVLQVMNKLNAHGVAVADARFNDDDEQMLRAFCAQAAVAIENSKLFTQTEKALNHALSDQRNLKFMLSVTKNLFSDMHLTSMIDQMTMQVHHLLKADDSALYLVDEKAQQFWLAKEETGTNANGDPNVHKYSYSVGIVGTVASTGQTIRISSQAHLDPRFHPSVDQRKGKVTHSILCCPIISEQSDGSSRIVGVISVRDEKDRGGFEQEEEKLLKVFCAQAAVAITNSKRFSSIMEQQEIKESDHSAAEYLKKNRGMNLADDNIAHFQYCLESSTRVALADGRTLMASEIEPEMELVGWRGATVKVAKVSPVPNVKEMLRVMSRNGAYTVTLPHRLTMRWNRAPTAVVTNSPTIDEPERRVMMVTYYERDTLKKETAVWKVEIQAADSNQDIDDEIDDGVTIEGDENDVATYVDGVPSTLNTDSSFKVDLTSLSHVAGGVTPIATLVGTRATLLSQVRTYLRKRGALTAGDVIEVAAAVLYEKWDEWKMSAKEEDATARKVEEPFASGYIIPIRHEITVMPSSSTLSSTQQFALSTFDQSAIDLENMACPPSSSSAVSVNRYLYMLDPKESTYRTISATDKMKVAYQHFASIDDENSDRDLRLALGHVSTSLNFRQLHRALGLAANGEHILVNEIAPPRNVTHPDPTLVQCSYSLLCATACRSLLTLSAERIVVFGDCARSVWLEHSHELCDVGTQAMWNAEKSVLHLTSSSIDRTIYFTSHPSDWFHLTPQVQVEVARTLAVAHELDSSAPEIQRAIRDWSHHIDRFTDIQLIRSLPPSPSASSSDSSFAVTNIELVPVLCPHTLRELPESRRFTLADGQVTHNSMENIVLKGSIGSGSYGEVYRAIVHNQVVAVKKLHVRNLKAEQVDAFCKEAALMCQLKHPNIVGFIGAVTEPSNLAIITQFCERGSLADLLLEPRIEMNFRLKMKFAIDGAKGLIYLHSSNPAILHRDLKSDNLLVTQDWTCKVADFGLTRFISEKKQMTQVGTPMWMAPEIIMGKKYTEKADVYAYGIILWEILTRLEPYEDKEPMQIVVEVVNDNLRPKIPPEAGDSPLVPLMKDCWHEDPNKRPSFEKILERLKAIEAALPFGNTNVYGIPITGTQ